MKFAEAMADTMTFARENLSEVIEECTSIDPSLPAAEVSELIDFRLNEIAELFSLEKKRQAHVDPFLPAVLRTSGMNGKTSDDLGTSSSSQSSSPEPVSADAT